MNGICIALQIFILLICCYANKTIVNQTEYDYTKDEEYLREQEIHKNITANWTTCDEFLENTTFDVNSVVDIDWQIFFFWNYQDENSYNIRFSIPTPILVDRFEMGLKDVGLNVNWSAAVLFMETTIDFSALYLTTDTPGKFRLIPSFAFGMDRVPVLIFGLKFVEPGYLAIMNCQQQLCYALAPSDKLPRKEDIDSAARKIGFNGNYNYSYLLEKDSMQDRLIAEEDNDDDDEEFEVENQLDEL